MDVKQYMDSFESDDHVLLSEYLLIFSILLSSSLFIQYVISKSYKIKFLQETGVVMLIGMVLSGIIKLIISTYPTNHNNNNSISHFEPNHLGFSSKVFYFGFLPPIIFNSGYHLKRRLFFANFVSIMSLAMVGTLISILVIAIGVYWIIHSPYLQLEHPLTFIECVTFGSLLSPTDPVATLGIYSSLKVDPSLFYIVFGESVLNDAIAITAFTVSLTRIHQDVLTPYDLLECCTLFTILFLLSYLVGYTSGIILAWIFRFIDFKNDIIVPVSIFLCAVYIPFFLSEMFQLSGVVAIFFAGISSRRYVNKNVSKEVRKSASFVFYLLSYLAEISCFSLLGVSVFLNHYSWNEIKFTVAVAVICLIARALSVYPILTMINLIRTVCHESSADNKQKYNSLSSSEITPSISLKTNNLIQSNQSNTDNKHWSIIPQQTQHMVFIAGLRGAVAYALANMFPDINGNRQLILNTTTIIILLSIFLLGGITEPMIQLLKIPTAVSKDDYLIRMDNAQRAEGRWKSDKMKREIERVSFERRWIYPLVLKPREMRSVNRDDRISDSIHSVNRTNDSNRAGLDIVMGSKSPSTLSPKGVRVDSKKLRALGSVAITSDAVWESFWLWMNGHHSSKLSTISRRTNHYGMEFEVSSGGGSEVGTADHGTDHNDVNIKKSNDSPNNHQSFSPSHDNSNIKSEDNSISAYNASNSFLYISDELTRQQLQLDRLDDHHQLMHSSSFNLDDGGESVSDMDNDFQPSFLDQGEMLYDGSNSQDSSGIHNEINYWDDRTSP